LLAVIVVMLVLAMGGAFFSSTLFQARESAAARDADEAQRIVDAALDQARRFLYVYKDTGSWGWDDILTYNKNFDPDPLAQRAAAIAALRAKMSGQPTPYAAASAWPEAPVPPDPKNPGSPGVMFGTFYFYGRGVWRVVVRNNPEEANPLVDTDSKLILYITATMPEGVQRSVEAEVAYVDPAFSPRGAVMTGGSVKFHGSSSVDITASIPGAEANVLSNANIEVQGAVKISG
jgi:type II secretory pathway pseudopilin PulG